MSRVIQVLVWGRLEQLVINTVEMQLWTQLKTVMTATKYREMDVRRLVLLRQVSAVTIRW